MASLMENLIDVLNKESSEYEVLLGLSQKKTPVIIAGDLEALQQITDDEQRIVTKVTSRMRNRKLSAGYTIWTNTGVR